MTIHSSYFSHDADAADDPKCVLLLDQLGPEGYGIFWLLVETLRKQDPNFSYPVQLLPALAKRFNTTLEKIKAVVTGYGLFVISDNNEIFFSESLIRRMQLMNEIREKKRIAGALGGRKKAENLALLQQNPSDALPIKRKIKEKVKLKSKEKEKGDFSVPVEFQNIWNKWLAYRKSDLKKPYKTTRGEQAAFNELLTYTKGDHALMNEIIDSTINKEWQSLTYIIQSKSKINENPRRNTGRGSERINAAWVRPNQVPTV